MSSLARYKKSGGFVQLLSLLETFGPQKKEKFLEMIDSENQAWGIALRDKMLTLERIFSWPDQVLIEVFKNLPPRNLAVGLSGIKEEQKARLLVFFSTSERRRLDDLVTENVPKLEEIAANMVKIVELTRKMLNDGTLRAERFDDRLFIPEDYEAKLDHRGFGTKPAAVKSAGDSGVHTHHHSPTADAHAVPSAEVGQLQKTLGLVLKENKHLKDEVRILREKLDQIKRIA